MFDGCHAKKERERNEGFCLLWSIVDGIVSSKEVPRFSLGMLRVLVSTRSNQKATETVQIVRDC